MRVVGWLFGGVLVLAVGSVAAWLFYSRNVETWPYAVVSTDGDFEIRDYPALTVAEVVRDGSRQEAVRAGFNPLAGYIFAREREGQKIAMTAPVTQQRDADASWRVQFIMPAAYALDDLPAPAGSDVRLLQTDPTRLAAVRFSGPWSDGAMAEAEARLRTWLRDQGLEPLSDPIFAYYNDPFTPGFLRRNEVLLEIGTSAP